MKSIVSDLDVDGVLQGSGVLRNGKVVWVHLPKGGSPFSSVVVRVRVEHEEYCLRISCGKVHYATEKANLDYLRRKGVDGTALPDIVEVGRHNGVEYSVMPFYRGVSVRSSVLVRKAVRRLVEQRLYRSLAADLTQLALRTRSRNRLSFQDAVENVVSAFVRECPDPRVVDFVGRAVQVVRSAWESIPLVFEHGDFQIGNIIITRLWPVAYRIIDWESGTRHGLPGVDLHNLVCSRGWSQRRIVRVLSRYCQAVGVDATLAASLVSVGLVRTQQSWKGDKSLSPAIRKQRSMRFSRRIQRVMSLAAGDPLPSLSSEAGDVESRSIIVR